MPPETQLALFDLPPGALIAASPLDVRVALHTPPPEYAIKTREGGGGAMYPYLEQGYVTMKMNEIFGADGWDFELLPVFTGNVYLSLSGEASGMSTGNPTMMVFGRLTVRFPGGQTVVKTAFGSAEWRKKQEPGDALKGAASDARKVCAAQLGPAFGSTLYWDDAAERAQFEKVQRKLKEATE